MASDSVGRTEDGSVVAWGCGRDYDYGQCDVPASARRSVIAISASEFHNLALKRDGSVVAWGCGDVVFDVDQCQVPASARRGVRAIAASEFHSLAYWGSQHDDQLTPPTSSSRSNRSFAAISGSSPRHPLRCTASASSRRNKHLERESAASARD